MEKEMGIRVQRLSEEARIRTKGWKLVGGHVHNSSRDIHIPANKATLVKIRWAIPVPEGTYGRIAPPSGLATNWISVDGGVIDPHYRGEVKVLLVNHNSINYEVKQGDQIADLIVEPLDEQD